MKLGPYVLRPDQEQAIRALRNEIKRVRGEGKEPRVILRAPTGAGKSLMTSAMISKIVEAGKRAAFLVHGRQLVYQMSRTLTDCEVRHAVLMADVGYDDLDGLYAVPLRGDLSPQVIVASKDTYEARLARDAVDRLRVDYLFVDECHASLSKSWLKILNSHPTTTVIGLTATPAFGDGSGLGGFYRGMAHAATYKHLISIGALVGCRVFAPYSVDMTGVRGGPNGEYNQREAAERFDHGELIGDVVENWKRYSEGRTTAVFAQSVAHSISLAEEFNRSGVPAAHIDADSPQDERESVFEGLRTGRLKVATNYGIMRTGVDLPFLGCGVLACSMKSATTYLQTVGRFVRSCKDPVWGDGPKKDCIVIDHGGNVYRHGWPTEDREWSLSTKDTLSERDSKRRSKEGYEGEMTCFSCGAMFDPRQTRGNCPNCGSQRVKRGQKVKMADGEIREITPKAARKESKTTLDNKEWHSAIARAAHCNMTLKQAGVLFKKKTGYWPPKSVSPQPYGYEWDRKAAIVYPQFHRKKGLKSGVR